MFQADLSEAEIAAERWAPVVGMEGRYEVSDMGRVRSLWFTNGVVSRPRPAPMMMRLKLRSASAPYPSLQLGKGNHRHVHDLVLRAFVGPPPPGEECCHEDGRHQNSRLANLYWGTRKKNAEDCVRHGTQRRGINHGRAKLSDEAVRHIRASEESDLVLAARFNVNARAINYVRLGKTWRHVK